MFFLTRLVSITHPLFQVTINMSSASGAEDSSAGRPPRDEDAEAAAVSAPGAELGRGSVQLGSAAADGLRAHAMLCTSGGGSTSAASAKKPLHCNEYPAEGANAASAEVRHSLTLLVLFCLYFCFLITFLVLVLLFHFYRHSKPINVLLQNKRGNTLEP